ncbi:MAG: ATP-binding cassette domain-containing protein [Bacteroidetes bacterium]|nr:ATP-binding cassette domain-containing protein [Bacteroidota bacterium]
MDLFTATNVSKTYAAHKALDKINIRVPEQSIFGLLGPNGAGKTTFIRIVNRIIAPDEGELIFNGKKLGPEDIGKIGYLPEERGLYKKMLVGEQALYLAQLKGLSHHDALIKLKYWFDKFEIRGWWNRKVEELSKGMQQKVQFIVTIVHNPKLLIFDEPFSGFDPINVNLLKEEILSLRNNGSTIIFSTHNMGSVEELCDHIALINNAKTILEGNVNSIKKTFKTNTFEICYTGYDEDLRNILSSGENVILQEKEDDHFKATVQLPAGLTTNSLIREMILHVTLQSFNEIIPSMNDIFIRTVTEKHTISPNLPLN